MAAILVFGAVALGAQTTGLTLVNGETVWLYYVFDPILESRTGETGGEGQGAFAVLKNLRFNALAPGQSRRISGVMPGNHVVIGFWATGDAAEYGVFSLLLSVEERKNKIVSLKRTGALAALERKTSSVIRALPETKIVIDNTYADWDEYPAVAVFPPSSQPAQFTYQAADGVRNLPIRNSNFWGRGGTQLLVLKAVFHDENLLLYFRGAQAFSSGLSIFFYLFDNRKSQEVNLYTIELPVNESATGGDILLWQRGEKKPVTIGEFRTAGVSLEGAVEINKLPPELRRGLFRKYSFDLKTSFHEKGRGFYEEFYFTSRLFSDIYAKP
jgi:hypothetical protein